MKLRKEENDDILEDSLEYKTALKSVIRSEIQNLLQKLALETGEESIVISTNVTAGTYNHLGSYLGREYLQDGAVTVEMLCENFMRYCKDLQNDCVVTLPDSQKFNSFPDQNNSPPFFDTDAVREAVSRQQAPLSRPINSHVRKRPPTKSPQVQDYPPSKKMNLTGPGLVHETNDTKLTNDSNKSDTSLVRGGNTGLPQEKKTSPEVKKNVPWIKVEPADELNEGHTVENDGSQPKTGSPEKNDTTSNICNSDKSQIKNRRKNLIPLANIFKKFGNNAVKPESNNTVKPESDQSDKPNNAQRNAFENTPVYKVNDLFSTNSDSETVDKVPVSLPPNLVENLASEDFSATTENLVLSGYYDSDVYPTYRHRQKHLLNKSASEKKPQKEKPKDKLMPASPNGSASENPSMKTYESGGRLVYSCDVCKRELSHLTSYRRHMKLHTMERPHVCPICHKGFIRKYHCIDHLNKHHKGVRFDPESLRLLDLPSSFDIEDQLVYSPGDLNTSEYNYTLDQSLAGSEAELSINEGIDQSASTMLSELAKSAAKLNQSESVKEILQSKLLIGSMNESKENLNQSDESKPEVKQSEEKNEEQKSEKIRKPTALEKIVAELRSAPKSKHKKESGKTNLADLTNPFEEIPTHLLKYADVENWICLLCDESFSGQASFHSHMAEHKSAEIVKCNVCPRGFISQEIYDEHLVTEHAVRATENMDM